MAIGSLVTACTAGDSSVSTSAVPVVRVAVLPDQDVDALESQYEPLLAYLDEAAGVRTELTIPDDYEDLLRRFADGELDLVWFGGLTFLRADADGGARPLVMRDVDLEFTTDILVAADAPGDSIEDFRGASFAFGPHLSTSGHLMPRFFLERHGFDPEGHFSDVQYSAGHDETARWIRDGVVDVGAVNSVVAEALFESGQLSPDDVRVLSRTDPYRNYTWATSAAIDDDGRTRLLDAFLALDHTVDSDRVLLDGLGAGGFVPATRSDFADLHSVATSLGLIVGDGTS